MREVKKFKPEIIYHCAAELKDEEKMTESNVLLTVALLEATKDIHYKAFVNLGSSSEYGPRNEPIKENMVLRPTTLYGATKAQATVACQNFAIRNAKPIITLRPFSPFGPGEKEDRLIPTAIRLCLIGKKMKLGRGVHDFIYVDDVIRAMFMFAGKPINEICGEVVNIASGIEVSNDEIIKTVERLCGKKMKIERIDRFHNYDTDHWVADIGRALSFGWCPTVDLDEGIERMIDAYRSENKSK
jgi:nucleoside-diphosphate-sugar epimerase